MSTKNQNEDQNKAKEIEHQLCRLFSIIPIDRPSNFEQILEFVIEDVEQTADPTAWHGGDVRIAFRRWIESKSE